MAAISRSGAAQPRSGVKLILCVHGKGRRDLSAEYSIRITVGYGDPARGQVRKLLRNSENSGTCLSLTQTMLAARETSMSR